MLPRILHTVGICLTASIMLNAQALSVASTGSLLYRETSEKKVRQFLEKFTPHAINITKQYGIPAELTLAVGALESGWGTSHLAEFANNYFGIKSKNPQEPVYLYTTREYSDGHYVLSTTSFRRYYLPEGSFWA
ncbi:MAG: glucosaminidase domain-containing protein, partial [Phaeodactylibacter sp.]|nr:glucosaminidase domain-containing protein [Phaeodactylibacter sp.]